MGKKVDRILDSMQEGGLPKESAIKIAKSKGTIHQSGKHLAAGPAKKKKSK